MKVGPQITRIFTRIFLPLVLLALPIQGQEPQQQTQPSDKAQLYQALLDLTNPWTVMCVAAQVRRTHCFAFLDLW